MSARTSDGLRWMQITTDTDASRGNLLVPDPQTEFREALDWVGSNTFWAPDVIQTGGRSASIFTIASAGWMPRAPRSASRCRIRSPGPTRTWA